jgi:histidine ammonia-lyase
MDTHTYTDTTMAKTVTIDGEHLTLENVYEVASGGAKVRIAARAASKMRQSRAFIEKALRKGEIIYGVTTGFGLLSDKVIDPSQIEALQRNLIRSHSVGVGPCFDETTTRAIMLLRANVLAMGYSGVRVAVLKTLVEMLNAGVHPVVPEQGSVGASGDLAPLAHLVSVLMGEGEAVYQGSGCPGRRPWRGPGSPSSISRPRKGSR